MHYIKILKFGGSSVANPERIENVCDIINKRAKFGDVVIQSAMGSDSKNKQKITDLLIEAGKLANEGNGTKQIVDEIRKRHLDVIANLKLSENLLDAEFHELEAVLYQKNPNFGQWMDNIQSFGERMIVKIVAARLRKKGIHADGFNSCDIGLLTNSNYGNASPLHHAYTSIKRSLNNYNGIAIVTGFIGVDETGHITTLGRGGSDYSAAIIAVALNADLIELWTDVNGIRTANPQIVEKTRIIDQMSYDEAKELAFYGAKLHPRTIWPAMSARIPVYIYNTFDPDGGFTKITYNKIPREGVVKGITCVKEISVITINSPRMIDTPGFLKQVSEIFEKNKIAIDMVSTSEANISLTTDGKRNFKEVIKNLKMLDYEITVKVIEGSAKICVVGEGMKHIPGVAARIFSVLARKHINIEAISQGASEINITFLVREQDANKAVNEIHKEFFN